jgi:hypothetical protein
MYRIGSGMKKRLDSDYGYVGYLGIIRIHNIFTQGRAGNKHDNFVWCFGSGSRLHPDSIGSVDPDPDRESGSGSRRPKIVPKKEEMKKFHDYAVISAVGSSDFDIFLEIQYASCVFGLALKS